MRIKFTGILDLDKIFNCGQCFRWKKTGVEWTGVVFGHAVNVYVNDNFLIVNSDLKDETFWSLYFDLGICYKKINEYFMGLDSILLDATKEGKGIRILRQDPWEALCSFIISQNNHIPRIKSIIFKLCLNFGTNIVGNLYSFPSANTISCLSINDLSVIKAGFRAKYILNASKLVSNGNINFDEIRKMNSHDALEKLQLINGVGPKIASCVLLYGFHRFDVFPIDTWINKVLKKFYKGTNLSYFGPYRGIAQQYLYYWSRNHPEIFT